MNRVGGHTLPKVTLQELLKTCMAAVLAAYEKLMEEKQEKVRERDGSLPQLVWDVGVAGQSATCVLQSLGKGNTAGSAGGVTAPPKNEAKRDLTPECAQSSLVVLVAAWG